MRANTRKPLYGLRKFAIVGILGSVMPFMMGGCNLGTFDVTSTVSLSGREVVSYLLSSLIYTPLQTAINNGVDNFFDKFEDEEN